MGAGLDTKKATSFTTSMSLNSVYVALCENFVAKSHVRLVTSPKISLQFAYGGKDAYIGMLEMRA